MAKGTRTTRAVAGAAHRAKTAKVPAKRAAKSVRSVKSPVKSRAKSPAKSTVKSAAKTAKSVKAVKAVRAVKKAVAVKAAKSVKAVRAAKAAKAVKAPAKKAAKSVKAVKGAKVAAKGVKAVKAAKSAKVAPKSKAPAKAVKSVKGVKAVKAVKAVKGPPALVPKPAPSRPVLSEVVTRRHRSPAVAASTLERLRAQLIEERGQHTRQAEGLLAEAEALANEREPGDTQFDEESGEGDTLSVERERDLALSASARQTVDDINKALVRMDDGSYGYCEVCGDRIPVPRLEAIPWADQCVKCKSRGERRR
jgi:RNA polymerase-binding protein DksA